LVHTERGPPVEACFEERNGGDVRDEGRLGSPPDRRVSIHDERVVAVARDLASPEHPTYVRFLGGLLSVGMDSLPPLLAERGREVNVVRADPTHDAGRGQRLDSTGTFGVVVLGANAHLFSGD
jgi:hypothetical protein